MTTIVVPNSYTLQSGKTLNFTDETGFELAGSGNPVLTIAGTLNATGGASVGEIHAIDGDSSVNLAKLSIQKSGVVHAEATGSVNYAYAANFDCPATVTNAGHIEAEARNYAVGLSFNARGAGDHNLLTNTGVISAVASDYAATAIFGAVDVVNSGLIHVEARICFAMQTTGSFENSGDIEIFGRDSVQGLELVGDFTNTGSITIDVTDGGVRGVWITEGHAFTNRGDIVVTSGEPAADPIVAVLVQQDSSVDSQLYENSGLISCKTAFDAFNAHGAVTLENTGQIVGIIDLSAQDDTLHNAGRITGDVFLGDGGDSYLSEAKGRLTGRVLGGNGDDLLVGGKAAETLVGDTGFGGSGGADTITGGGGADTLSGNGGADTFVYLKLKDSVGAKADLITDLDGADTIDLSSIDANSTRDGNQKFRLVEALDGHAGEVCLTYDAAHDVTRIKLDVDGDAKADAVIVLSGYEVGFDHFVF